jgi:DNA-binding winged helix-turn-helix (wHTH) protein/TolB-like protein
MAPVRFGIFDFDLSTCELRREGAPVRLQSQPAQVLAMLLERPGEVVTRETLRHAVWGADTFVDFDRGLNFCIAQIRSALGDSADSPRFVRTLPKRGYQFIAPVTRPAPASADTSKWRFAKPRPVVFGILAIIISAAVWLHPWSARRPASALEPIKIAVARFDNETGSADFDLFAEGLTDSVVAELSAAGTGRYEVIGNAAVLRKPRNQRDLIAIASSLQVGYVVLGQVQRNSSRIRVLAHLIRLPKQTHLWVTRLDRNVDDPLGAELELAQRIVADFSRRLTADSARDTASSKPVSN